MLGGKRAERKADAEHPFGYGRERYFWAFVVSLVLFSMGGLFALYEGFSKLRHPHEVENLPVAIVILLFSVALESFSLRTAYKEASQHKAKDIVVVGVHPRFEGTRAAGGAARGRRRRDRPADGVVGRAPRPLHRRAAMGRPRLDRHRPAARRHRRRAGGGDEGPAPRRVGVGRQHRRAQRRDHELAVGAWRHPHAHRAPRPRRAARGGQGGVRPRAVDGRAGRSRSTASRWRCAGPCRSPAWRSSNPTCCVGPDDVAPAYTRSRTTERGARGTRRAERVVAATDPRT